MSKSNSSRNPYSFPDFSLRRLLLQGARAARGGSPQLGTRFCDVERGNNSSNTIANVSGSSSSNNGNGNNNKLEKSSITNSGNIAVNNKNSDDASQHSGTTASNSQRLSSSVTSPQKSGSFNLECSLCCHNKGTQEDFYTLLTCKHIACRNCLQSYLSIEIIESRTDIACPQCSDSMHPSDIKALLINQPETIRKYEDFMVRRVLLSDPDSRWCPAPDCSYAVIASGCASCPRIKCERPGCDINFCYHCKAEWHPDQTCDAARAARHTPIQTQSGSISQDSQHRDDIKPCPRCQVLIVKMDDGSCNHMVCAVCGSEFCWLCMKVISDLHYLSPSGCTFWGKKPWSRKKKLLWQLGTLVGAPVGIALVAGIAVPAMIIGIPVWVGRKVHTRYKQAGKHKRNCAVLSGVVASVLVSPVLAGLAVAIGVPILLFYVYGVVPVSLCRAGCGVSTTRDGFKFDFDEDGSGARNQQDASSVDAISRIGATSIGEVSLSVASGSHLGVTSSSGGGVLGNGSGGACGGGTSIGGIGGSSSNAGGISCTSGPPTQTCLINSNRESTTALAGSITGHRLEVQADVSSSETASAVTCVSEKSGNTLNDTASTRALAGSILSYKQQMDSSNLSEDGASERVRFDNVCYVIDDRKDHSDGWSMTPLDQDVGADKSSVGSGRSFRSSDRSFREEIDSLSISSLHKRILNAQRMPKLNSAQHRNLSIESNNIPENINLEQEEQFDTNNHQNTPLTPSNELLNSSVDVSDNRNFNKKSITENIDLNNKSEMTTSKLQTPAETTTTTTPSSSATITPTTITTTPISNSTTTPTTKPLNYKNVSKAAILRNLFFSQNSHDSGGNSSTSIGGIAGGSENGSGNGNSNSSSGDAKTSHSEPQKSSESNY